MAAEGQDWELDGCLCNVCVRPYVCVSDAKVNF